MCLMAAFVPHRPNKYFHVTAPTELFRTCLIYTTRDHDFISNRIGSGTRNCPRCGCRLAAFAALPTPSKIDRAIIMLNDHRFRGYASGPSSPDKALSYFHPLLGRSCRLPQRPKSARQGRTPKRPSPLQVSTATLRSSPKASQF
jgi:hypothetical protein